MDVGVTGEFGEDPPRDLDGDRELRAGTGRVGGVVGVDDHHVLGSTRLGGAAAGQDQISQRQRPQMILFRAGIGRTRVRGRRREQRFERLTQAGVESDTGERIEPGLQIPHTLEIHPRAQTRRPPLTFQDVHAVGGLQAAGFVTHPPSELRLRRMLRHIHQRIHPTQQLLTLAMGPGSCRHG